MNVFHSQFYSGSRSYAKKSEDAEETEDSKEFVLRGAIISRVEYLGPSVFVLTTSYDAEKRWNAKLGHHSRDAKDLATARGLN